MFSSEPYCGGHMLNDYKTFVIYGYISNKEKLPYWSNLMIEISFELLQNYFLVFRTRIELKQT